MLISRTGSYALRACRFLALHAGEGYIPIREISIALHLPSSQYLTKVMQRLKGSQIVKTSKGPHGGVKLGKDPDTILLMDIIRASDPETYRASISKDQKLEFPETPELNHDFQMLENRFYSGLTKLTLKQFSKHH